MASTSPSRPLSTLAARAGAGAAAALVLGAALAACGSTPAASSPHAAGGSAAAWHAASYSAAAAVHQQPAPAAQGPGGTPAAAPAKRVSAPGQAGSTTAIILHIANTSNQVLHFVKADLSLPHQSVSPAPAATVGGNGGTDTIYLHSTDPGGADIDVTYRVGDTEKELDGHFKVPIAGFNSAGCTGLEGGPDCSIDHGYNPNAHWTITPGQVPATLGPAGTVWSFTKTGAAHSPQLLEVNEALAGMGAYQADTWQQTMDGNAIQANQLWTYQAAGDTGYGQLASNFYPGYCLQATNTSTVSAHPCTAGATTQLWRAVPGQAEGYGLQAKSTGAYLGVTDPGSGNGDYARMYSQQQPSLTDWAATPTS